MTSGFVDFETKGKSNRAFLAVPPAGKGKPLIVLQEWWGLVDHIKDVCERFAKDGFVAMAPDLYQGQKPEGPDDAGRMMMALNIKETAQELKAAIETISKHESSESTSVGVVGFCMGGQLALLGATVSDKVGAVVDFYGIHPKVELEYEKIKVPVLGIFAEKDQFVPPEKARELERNLKEKNKNVHFKVFPGVDHAFFNDSRPEVYDADAAKEAWEMTLEHLRKYL